MIRKRFYAFLTAIIVIFIITLPTTARISPLAFKGVTERFADGKEAYSPVLGMIALEQGLIYNLRFYGNFEPAYKNNKRDYIKDQSTDPLWNLVKALFPSPAGNLGVVTTAENNFGRYVTDPKAIALLLEYAHNFRTQLSEQKIQDNISIQEFLILINDSFIYPTADQKQVLQQWVESFREIFPEDLISKMTENDKKFLQENLNNLQDLAKIRQSIGNLRKIHRKYVQDKNILTKLIKKKIQLEPQQKIFNQLHKFLKNHKTMNSILDKFLKLGQFETKQAHSFLRKILNHVAFAIVQEEGELYPKYTTEQVILAFFCEKFDRQTDIWNLLSYLPGEIVQNKTFPEKEDLLVIGDLDLIRGKFNNINFVTFDDFYNLANAEIFYNPVPYKAGVQPLSNGNTHVYNRKTDEEIRNKYFADCVEISLRHLVNLVTYDPKSKLFNLEHINEYVQQKESHNPFFNNFLAFYEKQIPDLANAGNIEIRSLWNRVVGDLNIPAPDNADNRPKDIQVIYARTYEKNNNIPGVQYELEPGFINFINVFRKIFNPGLQDTMNESESPEIINEGVKDKKKQIEKDFKVLLTTLNPSRTYDVEYIEMHKGKTPDLFGKIKITVAENNELLFSFVIVMTEKLHGEINNLEVLSAEQNNYREYLERYLNSREIRGTSTDSLVLLLKQPPSKQYPLLYQLFPKTIQDNKGCITFVQTLQENYQDWINQNLLDKQISKNMFNNVLRTFSWDDRYSVQIMSQFIPHLLEYQLLDTSIVKGLETEKITDKDLENITSNFVNLEYLYLPKTKKLKRISENNLNLPNLKELDLYGAHDLEQISVDNLQDLEYLDLSKSPVKDIIGLNNLLNLKELNLSKTPNLEEISVDSLQDLEYLNLSKSPVKDIIGLNNLSNLKELNLSDTSNLEEISVGNLQNLESLELSNSQIKKVTGLGNLLNLNKLNLYGSPLAEITGLNKLSNLEELNLSKTENLNKISLENLHNLKILSLRISPGIEITGFNNLLNLEKLYLSEAKSLNQIPLENLPNLKMLNLRGSSISKEEIADIRKRLPANVRITR